MADYSKVDTSGLSLKDVGEALATLHRTSIVKMLSARIPSFGNPTPAPPPSLWQRFKWRWRDLRIAAGEWIAGQKFTEGDPW